MKGPTLEKIVLNTSVGRLSVTSPEFTKKVLPAIKADLARITGQAPQERPARQSIAGFKLREGMIVGLRTTLRRKRMHDFLSRTVNIALPRIRDFKGISLRSIDESGNLTIGIKEHTVYPEISLEDTEYVFGLQMTLVLREPLAKEEAVSFYRSLGIPLEREPVTSK